MSSPFVPGTPLKEGGGVGLARTSAPVSGTIVLRLPSRCWFSAGFSRSRFVISTTDKDVNRRRALVNASLTQCACAMVSQYI